MSPSTHYRERLRIINKIRKGFGKPALRQIIACTFIVPGTRARILEQSLGVHCKVEAAWIQFFNPLIADRVRMIWISAGYRVTQCKPNTKMCVSLPKPLQEFMEGVVPR